MKPDSMPVVRTSSAFEQRYKKKKESAPEHIVRKAKEAIRELISTSNPESCGIKKKGKLGDHYSIELPRAIGPYTG
jgi:mRNA-degrading endonuclease RelE of RelBE toxin-antitoxin system